MTAGPDTAGVTSPVTTFATAAGLAPLGKTSMGTPNGRPTVSIVLPCYNEEGHVVAEVEIGRERRGVAFAQAAVQLKGWYGRRGQKPLG